MATMNISLPGSMKEWIDSRLKGGHFGNTSDYVRHLIRMDQERTEAITSLQAAIDEGLSSGEPQPLDLTALKKRLRKTHGGT